MRNKAMKWTVAAVAVAAVVGSLGVMAASGQTETDMRQSESVKADRTWAPTGQVLYGRDQLYVADADGSDEHALVVEPVAPGAILHGDWSPDGTEVAFEIQGDDVSVWTVNADGTSPQLRAACTHDPCLQMAEPSWSPDGKQLVVVQYDANADGTWGRSWLVVVDLATGATHKVARTPDDRAFYFPRWSNDGRRIVVEVDYYTDNTQSDATGTAVAIVSAEASPRQRVRVVTSPEMLANHPDWHPSKNVIVFSTNDPILFSASSDPSNIWVMRPDGQGMRQLTTSSTDGTLRYGTPSWSPDGNGIVLMAAYAEENGGSVTEKHPAYLPANGGTPKVLAVRGADPRLRP
jgi:Tol biopolymer transport system component